MAPTAIVRPRSSWARFSSGALGSKPAANSLRKVMATMFLSAVLAIASRRWPRAAARVSVEPPPCEKSALPEITALAAPIPVTWIILKRNPCFPHSPSSSAMKVAVRLMVMSSGAACCAWTDADPRTQKRAAQACRVGKIACRACSAWARRRRDFAPAASPRLAPLPTLRISAHIFVGGEAVIGFQLLLRLEQPGADIEQLGILQVGLADDRRARGALADLRKAGGEQLLVEGREALLERRECVVRAVEHQRHRLRQRLAELHAGGLALLAGLRLGDEEVVGERIHVGGVAVGAARDRDRAAVEHRLQRPRHRHREAVDLPGLDS